jgi:type II secretory pathway component PulL
LSGVAGFEPDVEGRPTAARTHPQHSRPAHTAPVSLLLAAKGVCARALEIAETEARRAACSVSVLHRR